MTADEGKDHLLTEPGAIAFVRTPGSGSQRAWTGAASLEHAVPIDAGTVMNVGSIAKQITARLILHAAQHGDLRLDNAVADLLPRMRVPDVTVLDLIRHSGGIRDAESMLSLAALRDLDHYTSSDLLALAYRQHRRATPADTFLYSNTGYLMLAEILRTTYGQPLHDIASEHIFKPLGMTSATFKADPRTVIPKVAASYRRFADGAWTSESRPVALDGPGSLWCSVDDLDLWLKHLRSEWVAHSEPSLPFASDVPYVPSDHAPYLYGPGLYADPRPGGTTVFHFGHEQGYSAAAHLTRGGVVVICMSNRADLLADRLARLILQQSEPLDDLDIHQLLRKSLQAQRNRHQSKATRAPDSPPATDTPFDYISEDVPGVLQLVRHSERLYLKRRGSRDQLAQPDPAEHIYTGPGYQIRNFSDINDDLPTTFILDLDRAPGLVYRRRA